MTSATGAAGGGHVAVCVDAGTTTIKAVVFDEAGRELLLTRRDTAVRTTGTRSEQDMDEVWEAVVGAVAEAVRAIDRPVRLHEEFLATRAPAAQRWRHWRAAPRPPQSPRNPFIEESS